MQDSGSPESFSSPGDFVRLPCKVAHNFQNNGNVDAKFLVMTSPAGLERFFEEGFYPAEDWPDVPPPMDDAFMARLLPAAARCDLELLAPA
jgi:hypothetical protein